ncbi:MAG: hypothetical protein KIT17_00645 [Rubrivivax sp.]|nr:hypothetical protein [Rubrivivax sp.]
MRNDELPAFTALLDGTHRLLSRNQYEPNPTSTALFFAAMRDYTLDQVRAALDNHLRTSRFVPMPADLLDFLRGDDGSDGRPGAEEAWAAAMLSRDENETVVWTEETAKAWGVAAALLQTDEVGARMAFREVYLREVKKARAQRRPLKWQVMLGHDQARRAEAVRRAQAEGKAVEGPELEALAYTPARGPVELLEAPASAQVQSPAAIEGRAKLRVLTESMKARICARERSDAVGKELTKEAAERAAERVADYEARRRTSAQQEPLPMPRKSRGVAA